MKWNVEYTNEFEAWWNTLDEDEQNTIDASVTLLENKGSTLPYPYSSGIKGSKHNHMRELRIQHQGEPYRVLFAFDPRRSAILLIGGNKTGYNRWYERYIPIADKLYDDHLKTLEDEGLL